MVESVQALASLTCYSSMSSAELIVRSVSVVCSEAMSPSPRDSMIRFFITRQL
jgi:hypothetical protein